MNDALVQVDSPPHPSDEAWLQARAALATRLSPGDYQTWIEPLKLQRAASGLIILAGPNSFFLDWIKNNFITELRWALAEAGFEESSSLEFVTSLGHTPPLILPESLSPATRCCSQTTKQPGLTGHPSLSDRFSFDNFVVGDSNLYAFAAAKALAEGASLGADALFITSDHGLCKSHLSLAMSRAFQHSQPRQQVYYLTAEDFTNEMTLAIRHGAMEDFKTKFRQNCDVLVLEEVQFLAGKEKIQSELCFTLDILMERGKKLVFTSPQEPKGIPKLSRGLRSRLSTALVSPIGPPEYDTRLKILIKKAETLGLKISRSVLEYVAERVTADVRQLESCLTSLKARSQLLGHQVDMDMARETLTYLFDDHLESGLNPSAIRALICHHFHLDVSEITSKNRSSKINEARCLGMYLARRLTGRTLEEIGQIFGRTHSSALYAINKMEQLLKKDPKLQGKVDYFNQKIMSEDIR
ncbi:MAG: chromosomal replication initiator protein DnaA [Candidatus Adiutrix sp.]|jgi:chromosomal replication initiator protein|nr:chromosomal replication initiator protein DnaA [Candidatus Adiutrix sp.]